MRRLSRWVLPVLLASQGLCATALAAESIRLDDPGAYDLRSQGFQLERAAEVTIEARGVGLSRSRGWSWFGHDDDDEQMLIYAWLIDSDTRAAIWVMDYDESSKQSRRKYLREAEARLDLEAGRYELYFFSGLESMSLPVSIDDTGDDDNFWERLFGDRKARDEFREGLDSSFVSVSFGDLAPRDLQRFDVTGELSGALVRSAGLGDSRFETTAFELDRTSAIRVYALIEKVEKQRTSADYGWIVERDTREIVWSANDARSIRAGGGTKNRLVDDEIELPAGSYILHYGTDDSHSLERFNAMPPTDPFNWGVTLLPGTGMDPAAFREVPAELASPAVALNGVGNNAATEQPFRMERGGRLHVLALGEYGDDDDEFYDHGWIVDARSGETVWEMTRRNTVGAGGAEKNRRFDGLVELPAGDYIAYYVTDGSHSFRKWNSARPFEGELWGLTIRPGPGFAATDVRLLDTAELAAESGTLVSLVRLGDHELERMRFELDRPTRVKIYAIGEGQRDEMSDYGYIVDDGSGRRVWEMRYDDTRHAGGATKNRLASEELTLGPGSYEAVFVTDGSHSFEEWNAARPRDPLHWGMTIRRAED
jgi:hypothetical protein